MRTWAEISVRDCLQYEKDLESNAFALVLKPEYRDRIVSAPNVLVLKNHCQFEMLDILPPHLIINDQKYIAVSGTAWLWGRSPLMKGEHPNGKVCRYIKHHYFHEDARRMLLLKATHENLLDAYLYEYGIKTHLNFRKTFEDQRNTYIEDIGFSDMVYSRIE